MVFENYPAINCYPEYGAMFSILENKCTDWMLSHLIQIKLDTEVGNLMTFDGHDELFDLCPETESQTMNITDSVGNDNDRIHAITSFLDENQCVFIYVDRFYVEGTEEYGRFHYIHKSVVCGYDEEEKVIYLSDNFRDGKFMTVPCGYEAFRKATFFEKGVFIADSVLKKEYRGDLCEYAKSAIDQKGHAFAFLCRHLIKKMNLQTPFAHDIELVGYNEKKQEFDVVYEYGKHIKTVKCGYDELRNAYSCDIKYEHLDEITVVAKKPLAGGVPAKKEITATLKEFVSPSEGDEKIMYGTDAMRFMYLVVARKGFFRIRLFHFLYEHALLMEMRVSRLVQEGLITADSSLLEEAGKIKKEFFVLRNTAIKYSVTKKQDDLDNLCSRFENAVNHDEEFFEKLIAELER